MGISRESHRCFLTPRKPNSRLCRGRKTGRTKPRRSEEFSGRRKPTRCGAYAGKIRTTRAEAVGRYLVKRLAEKRDKQGQRALHKHLPEGNPHARRWAERVDRVRDLVFWNGANGRRQTIRTRALTIDSCSSPDRGCKRYLGRIPGEKMRGRFSVPPSSSGERCGSRRSLGRRRGPLSGRRWLHP